MIEAAELLARACDHPAVIAAELRASGHRPVRIIGYDAPFALLRAAGLAPVRIVPMRRPTPHADALLGRAGSLAAGGRSLLDQLLADDSNDPILITHAESDLAQVFAMARELMRNGDMPARPMHMFDAMYLPRVSSRRYNRRQIDRLLGWLPVAGGCVPDETAYREAVIAQREVAHAIARLTGVSRAAAMGAACALMPDRLLELLHAIPPADGLGRRVFLAGSPQPSSDAAREIRRRGLDLTGDDQDWGDPLLAAWRALPYRLDDLEQGLGPVPRRLVPVADRAAHIIRRMADADIPLLLFDAGHGDEAAAWDRGFLERAVTEAGFAFEDLNPQPARTAPAVHATRKPSGATPARSRKTLKSLGSFGEYQREWFAGIRSQVIENRCLFAAVNANAPQEILRAMGVPFVVNQWWASIVAAKQQSARYLGLLEARGYPRDAEAYSAQGLAALFDRDAAQAPWGGLPVPGLLEAVLSTDATPRIFDHWARESGAELLLFEQSLDTRLDLPLEWWDLLPDHWDEVLQPERIDLMVEELTLLIDRIEAMGGHRYREAELRNVMELVNEQEEYYCRARNLIAAAPRVPISIVDSMPATMVPQWHRGTPWARDAARRFHDEVAALIATGHAACRDERLRLMWVGRGLWSDLAFYQRWQQSHGAVFVWSMYLGLAADGYIRRFDRGRDVRRALASRFVTMGDELRMPSWAGPWHVREAQSHRIDGAIALADADPFVLRALCDAGVPVLALDLDNYHLSGDADARIEEQVTRFLDRL